MAPGKEGRPKRDAAGAACRNAAVALEELYKTVQRAVVLLPETDWPCALDALGCMNKAVRHLHEAADAFYQEEER